MKVFFALLFLPLVACAHPNYQDIQTLTPPANKTHAACDLSFTKENLCATWVWNTQPTEDANGNLTVTFTDKTTGAAVDPHATLKVLIWMPDMGHPSSPTEVTRKATGVYFVDRVFFSMKGAWQIRFQLKNAAALEEEQIADVTF